MVNIARNLLIQAKYSTTDAFKITSKRVIQKTAETTGDLIGNKIANTIKKVSRSSLLNNSETFIIKQDKEISKERYISPDERQKIIDDLRLI